MRSCCCCAASAIFDEANRFLSRIFRTGTVSPLCHAPVERGRAWKGRENSSRRAKIFESHAETVHPHRCRKADRDRKRRLTRYYLEETSRVVPRKIFRNPDTLLHLLVPYLHPLSAFTSGAPSWRGARGCVIAWRFKDSGTENSAVDSRHEQIEDPHKRSFKDRRTFSAV